LAKRDEEWEPPRIMRTYELELFEIPQELGIAMSMGKERRCSCVWGKRGNFNTRI